MEHVNVWEKVIASSPVIVLVLLGGMWLLWQRLKEKDDVILRLMRETLEALGAVKEAVRGLKESLDRNSHHP